MAHPRPIELHTRVSEDDHDLAVKVENYINYYRPEDGDREHMLDHAEIAKAIGSRVDDVARVITFLTGSGQGITFRGPAIRDS